jgi:dUTP pyrophosphatase
MSEAIPVRMEFRVVDGTNGKSPVRSRTTDAGYDIRSIEEKVVHPKQMTLVETGIAVAAPPGYYYTTEARSGLLLSGIIALRGIIDAGYCGKLVIVLMNISDRPYKVNVGDRIAQIVIHPQQHGDFVQVEKFSAEYSTRGEAGWGSSGK